MCYFITIGIKEDAADELRQIVPRGMRIDKSSSAWLSQLMGEGWRQFVLTSGGCSCDLYREAAAADEDEAGRIDRLTRKYVKKGWSDAKIQRAIGSRASKPKRDDFVGLRQDVRDLVMAIIQQTPKVGIVVHFYSGDIETEKFSVGESRSITADGLRRGTEPVAVDALTWVEGSHSRP